MEMASLSLFPGLKYCVYPAATALQCGPHGAMNHPNVPLEDCPPIKKELIISEKQAFQFLRARRSIRV